MQFIYLFSLFFLISCTSLKKGDDSLAPGSLNPKDRTLFETAFNYLGEERYKLAIPLLEKLSQKYQGQEMEWATLFNLALAYKETNQCEKAQKSYQYLLTKIKKLIHLKPRTYLALSYASECLSQPENTLFALKEGYTYINHLPMDVQLVEYPARLALAYIRAGEDKFGQKIAQQMYQNMEMLKKTFRISSAADKNFSRYFYIVGRSHVQVDHVNLKTFLKVFPYHQLYLTQSILLNTGEWSKKAEKELGDLYHTMWEGLKKQNNKKIYRAKVKKNLNQLKHIERTSKNKKMRDIYRGLRQKTLYHLK